MLSPLLSVTTLMYHPQIALLALSHTCTYMYIYITVKEFIYHNFWSIFIWQQCSPDLSTKTLMNFCQVLRVAHQQFFFAITFIRNTPPQVLHFYQEIGTLKQTTNRPFLPTFCNGQHKNESNTHFIILKPTWIKV